MRSFPRATAGAYRSDYDPEMTVEETVAALTRAWLDGRYEDLAGYFDPDVVLMPPGFTARVVGREACVQSYRDFGAAATIHEFTPAPPQVDVWGDTAVAVCPFSIVYEMQGATYDERGVDLLVLAREAGAWRVVFRTMAPPEPAAAPATP